MNLGRSTFVIFLSKSGNAVLLFAGITFFARHMETEELGIFFLFLALVSLLSIPADVGIRGAVEKRLSEGSDPERTLGSAFAFKLVLVGLVSGGILAARTQLNAYLGANLAWVLVPGLVVYELSKFYVQAVRGELRVGETAPIEFVRRFVWIVLGAVLAVFGFGAEGIVVGWLTGSTVAFLWAYRKCTIGLGRPSLEHVRSLVRFSKYDMVASIGGRVYQWLDLVIVGLFLAQQYVSAYEVAWQVTLLVLLASKSVALTIFPQISRWEVEEATNRISSVVSMALSVSLFASVPAIVGAILYSTEILRFVFGPEYTIATGVLIVLMIEKLFQSFNDVVGNAVRAIDRPDLAAKATVISVGINVLLSPILLLTVGFVGAAVATTVAWFANTAIHAVYLSRLISLEIPFRLLKWYAVASSIMGGLLVVVKTVAPVTDALLLVVHVVLGVAIYVGISFAIPAVRNRVIVPGLQVLHAQLRRQRGKHRWRF